MSKKELETMLVTCIREVQELSGKQPRQLTLDTCPFDDLEEFDSLTAVETTELLSRRLQQAYGKHIHCGKGDVNLFVSEDGHRPLKLSGVVERMESLIVASHEK